MKRSVFLSVFLMFFLGFVGCATFNDYKPKTADEEKIKNTLVTYFESWNNHNADGVLSVIHKDARIMTGSERRMVSKQQFSEILPDRFEKNPKVKVGSPKMNVKGDEATLTAPMSGPGWSISWAAKLVKENGKWYIINSKY